MPHLFRQLVLAAGCALATCLSLPALANAADAPVSASTALKTQIIQATRAGGGVGVNYQWSGPRQHPLPQGSQRQFSVSASNAASTVNKTPADAAQLPAKLEWLLGVYLQIRGDNAVSQGSYNHPPHQSAADRQRLIAAAVADYRLSNFYIAQADTLLGIRHPKLSAAPYRGDRSKPAPSASAVTPTVSITARLTLAQTVAMGATATAESVPRHLWLAAQYQLLGPNETACQYYALLAGALPVAPLQRAAQRDWVDGLDAQRHGDDMLFLGLYDREPTRAADQREADAGLATLKAADAQIARAEAALGVKATGPSARLPQDLILGR